MRTLFLASLAAVAAACGTPAENNGTPDAGPAPLCSEPAAVSCATFITSEMRLQTETAPGQVTNIVEGGGFKSHVDSTAGGLNADMTPKLGFVYARFTDQGLVKVAAGDSLAFTTMDWDLAFRRYIVRLNSGDSGPSCVQAARMHPSVTYESLAAVPESAGYHTDDYVTADCSTIAADGTGFPASPATTLGGYYTYTTPSGAMGCVQMTDAVYVIQLANNRHVKVQFTSYYDEAVQAQCDSNGTLPVGPSGSGNVRLRWAFLD